MGKRGKGGENQLSTYGENEKIERNREKKKKRMREKEKVRDKKRRGGEVKGVTTSCRCMRRWRGKWRRRRRGREGKRASLGDGEEE